MLDAMRSGVQDFISKPATPDAIRVILSAGSRRPSKEQITSQESLIVLMGAKGGVGTTTVAVNLGVHLDHARAQAHGAARFRPAAGKRSSLSRSAPKIRDPRRDG